MLRFCILFVSLWFANIAGAVEQSAKGITISQFWSKDGVYTTNGYSTSIAPVNGAVSDTNLNRVDVSSILNIQRQNFNGMTDEAIRNSYSTYANGFLDSILPSIKQLMTTNNFQTAVVKFEQQFVQGVTLKRVINRTLIRIVSSGQTQITRLGTTIIRDPIFLRATYISKKLSAEVPSQYAYPNAGKIVYRLFDKNNSPLTNELVVDVNGAYDQLSASDVTPQDRMINTAWMPECLVARDWADYVHEQQGVTLDGTNLFKCPTSAQGATTDLKTLAAQHDATDIILDYSERLSVVYDNVDPACTTDCQQVARVVVDVQSRTLAGNCTGSIFAGGSKTFRVTGSIGYSLKSETTQYHAKTENIALYRDSATNVIYKAGSGITALNNVVSQASTPTQTFDKSVDATNGTVATYQNLVINPFPNANPAINLQLIDWRSDTLNGLTPDRYCYAGQCSRIAPIVGN